ncbi:hypothetical protein D3C85_1930300 [compost metagenome]
MQFKPIDRRTYDQAVADVEEGRFDLRIRPVEFSLDAFLADPVGYPRTLQEVLA